MEQKKYTGNPTGHGRMHGPGMRRGGRWRQSRDFKGTWKKLIAYCSKYTAAILIAIVCAAGGTIFTLVGPDKLSELTGVIAQGLKGDIDMHAVAAIGRTLILFYICSIILSFTQHFIMTTIAQILSRQMRRDITQKINRLPMDYYNRTSHGDILSRGDQRRGYDLPVVLTRAWVCWYRPSPCFWALCLWMLITNVLMTLTAIVAIFIGFMLMRLITSHSQKYFARQQRHLGELTVISRKCTPVTPSIKAYNGEAHAQETFDALNGDLRDSAFKAQCLGRSHAADDDLHRKSGLRGGLRHRSGPDHARTDWFRGHRRLYDVRPFLHPATLPDRAGRTNSPVRRCRRRTCF